MHPDGERTRTLAPERHLRWIAPKGGDVTLNPLECLSLWNNGASVARGRLRQTWRTVVEPEVGDPGLLNLAPLRESERLVVSSVTTGLDEETIGQT